MQQNSPDELAESLYARVVSVGLSKATVEASTCYFLNYRKLGRIVKTTAMIKCQGTHEQEEAFKLTLDSAEAEDVLIQRVGPGTGDDCPQLQLTATKDLAKREFRWDCDDPKVYLVDFWASWCKPCAKPMNELQEILSRNPGWQGKVEVVAVSLDHSAQDAEQWIQRKGWTLVSGYWHAEGDFNSPLAQEIKITGIPTALLVKKGKIRWRGRPGERNLEADINYLIDNDELPVTVPAKSASDTPVLQGAELESKLQEVEAIFSAFVDANPFYISPFLMYRTTAAKTAQHLQLSARVSCQGSYPQTGKESVEAAIKPLRSAFESIDIRLSYCDTVPTISRGSDCSLCGQRLTDVQYLCVSCDPPHYHCQECESSPRNGRGSGSLAHPHKLYKITPDSSHFEEMLFGPNLPLDVESEELVPTLHESVFCNNESADGGCSGQVHGARFKCAHCKDFDFCAGCESLFWTHVSEDRKRAVRGMGHLEHHVLIKIPFPLAQ